MSPYVGNGSLTTDSREVAVSESWDTQTEWEAFPSKTDVDIVSGVLQLAERTAPASGISRWTFDDADTSTGTTSDVWNGYDGTLNGGVTTGAVGQYNEAFSFDGADDYVDCGDVTEINGASAFTVAVWLYNQNSSSDYGMAVTKTDNGGGTPADNAFALFKGNQAVDELRFAVGDGSTEYGIEANSLPQDTWTMATGVYDGSDLVLYANDTEVARLNVGAITVANSSQPVRVGRRGDGLYFAGRIDDPRLYDKGLTATEVSNLYSTGSIS